MGALIWILLKKGKSMLSHTDKSIRIHTRDGQGKTKTVINTQRIFFIM